MMMKLVPTQKILVVDDVASNLKVMRASLKKLDTEIITASSGAEALEQVATHRFCLILLDVQMPQMDGHEVARRLQNNTATANIPIIFVTAMNRDDDYLQQGYHVGAVDYLFKPINVSVLIAKVKIFLKLAKISQQLEDQKNSLEQAVANRTMDLEQALDQAKTANKAKSIFLANISHELRTPMHAILSFSKLGLKKIEHQELEKIPKYFGHIYSSGQRLSNLVEDLLDLSKYHAGEMKMEFNMGNLMTCLKCSLEEISPLIEEKNIALKLDIADDITTTFDKTRMHQVFINLLSNALKFTDAGKKIEIICQLKKYPSTTEQVMQLKIIDNGIGIPEAELKDIFKPFIQSSRTENQAGGTGLGLSICKEIIEAHNGRIWAENITGCGAAFTIQLPLFNAQT